jgi:hypothetical protein
MDFGRLDLLLKNAAESQTDAGFEDKDKGNIKILRKFGYITLPEISNIYNITPGGMMFYQEGGFRGFLNRNKLEKADIEWRIKLSMWYHRSRWSAPI